MTEKPTEFASTRLTPKLLEQAKQIARSREWSLSKTLAKLIEKGLEKLKP